MASRQPTLLAHYTRLLARWPVDRLRPETLHFQRLLQSRIDNPTDANSPLHSSRAEKEINAAYLLLDNTFTDRYRLSQKMMRPASQPEHYEALARELEEAPGRGFFDRVMKRVKGLVRWS